MSFVFIVPIRHPKDCRDVDEQRRFFNDLFGSIARQTSSDWRCILVANPEQQFPPLPERFSVQPVDLAPNSEMKQALDDTQFYAAFRQNKGLRVQAALRTVDPEDHVMVADDDDLVSAGLVEFVTGQEARTGWFLDKGYRWASGADHFFEQDDFHKVCGTSLICPARYFDAYGDTEDARSDTAIAELGSHRMVFEKIMGGKGAEPSDRFRPVPFRGAVYRVGHTNATQSDLSKIRLSSLLDFRNMSLFSKARLKNAARFVLGGAKKTGGRRIALDASLRAEFFGTGEAR